MWHFCNYYHYSFIFLKIVILHYFSISMPAWCLLSTNWGISIVWATNDWVKVKENKPSHWTWLKGNEISHCTRHWSVNRFFFFFSVPLIVDNYLSDLSVGSRGRLKGHYRPCLSPFPGREQRNHDHRPQSTQPQYKDEWCEIIFPHHLPGGPITQSLRWWAIAQEAWLDLYNFMLVNSIVSMFNLRHST